MPGESTASGNWWLVMVWCRIYEVQMPRWKNVCQWFLPILVLQLYGWKALGSTWGIGVYSYVAPLWYLIFKTPILYIYPTHIICDFYKHYSIIARSCESEPPETFLGIDVDWPKKSRLSGTKVIYTCPYKKITDQDMLAGKIIVCLSSIILGIIIFVKKYKKYCFISEQYTHCIWDKDTDEMIWYPNEIYECTRKYKYIIKLLIFWWYRRKNYLI